MQQRLLPYTEHQECARHQAESFYMHCLNPEGIFLGSERVRNSHGHTRTELRMELRSA